MTFSEVAERLERLGYRKMDRLNDAGVGWVNPRTGVSIRLPDLGDTELNVTQLIESLEKLGLSWSEFENA